MSATGKRLHYFILILLVALGLAASHLQGAAAPDRLKTIVDEAGLKATPEIGAKSLARLPLGTVLETLEKQGEWYRVTAEVSGNTVTGYIHEMLVEQLEGDEDLSPVQGGGAQAALSTQISLKIEEARELIRKEQDLQEALQTLDGQVARVFQLDDHKLRRQLAVEIFYWMGLARIAQKDDLAALKEFKKMFELDVERAREASRRVSQPRVVAFLHQAEQEFLGLEVDYTLEVSTKPSEAEVTVNGKEKSVSPATFRSRMPRFAIEVKKPGYKPIRDEVFVTTEFERMEYALEAISRSVAFISHPPGAAVFIDGSETGKKTDCIMERVALGTYQVRLAKDNFFDWVGLLTVPEGEGPLTLESYLVGKAYASQALWPAEPGVECLKPACIAADAEGQLYIADESAFRIRKFSPEGRWLKDWSVSAQIQEEVKYPAGLAVDKLGNIYISDVRRNIIFKIDETGNPTMRFGREGTGRDDFRVPADLAVNSEGYLYVVDWGNNRVKKYSPKGVLARMWGSRGEADGLFSLPRAIAINDRDEVYVLDKSRVQRFTADGVFLGAWGRAGQGEGEFNEPMGLFVDKAGSVYVADTGNHRVQKFDEKGGFITQWGSRGKEAGELGFPIDILVDSRGRLLIAEKDNNRIQVFVVPSN